MGECRRLNAFGGGFFAVQTADFGSYVASCNFHKLQIFEVTVYTVNLILKLQNHIDRNI